MSNHICLNCNKNRVANPGWICGLCKRGKSFLYSDVPNNKSVDEIRKDLPRCFASKPNVVAQAENDCGSCPVNSDCITEIKIEDAKTIRDNLIVKHPTRHLDVEYNRGIIIGFGAATLHFEKKLTRILHELKVAEAGFAAKGYGNAALSEAILLVEETK